MKKLTAMLLALCMLGIMGMAAAEENQKVSTAIADFDLPLNTWYGITYQQGGEAGIYAVINGLSLNIHLEAGAAGQSQQETFDEKFSYHVSAHNLTLCEFTDWGLADQEAVMGAYSDAYGVFVHCYPWAVMDIRVEDEGFTFDSAVEAVKPIFASLCQPAGVAGAVYSNPLIAVKLPEAMIISCAEDILLMAENENYQLTLVSLPYVSEEDYFYVEDLTVNSFQYNNLVAMMHAAYGKDADPLLSNFDDLKVEEIGMLNGQVVAHGFFDNAAGKMAVCAQQYQGVGYVILVNSLQKSGSDALAFADRVAMDMRMHGVSEEKMKEDALMFAAEREAAAQNNLRRVKITGSGVNIRSGPDASYEKIAYAYRNATFPYLGERGNWYRVDVDGQVGYISKNLAKRVK